MLANVHLSLPKCSECGRAMSLVHVLANAHVYPPVRTFECAPCATDAIFQWQPPADHTYSSAPSRAI
jgi:hypothetical protein